ncbi:lysocardiolipin and lysophospholipid acyltransferase [Nematocida homosporus]|uniref:lysocardiolipin and lysophospholipid acyltransferase n=1 Tax=Nematocida homosporus TaxID=1912981 RepID=UPI00221E40B9|nr:lysocardiolipin and lysophospholipid acyltransferase [Nematocida homosporus]KAI5184553.1 lysocardiolipin and lysophospholipid acyltransferase [Nematocida homosporus]
MKSEFSRISISSYLKASFFFLSLVFYLVMCTTLIPLVFLYHEILTWFNFDMRKFKVHVGKLWLVITHSLIAIAVGGNAQVIYDKRIAEKKDAKSILLSNHITYLDWIFIWSALLQLKKQNIRFVAKEGIGSIFFLGMGMRMLNFILLSREMKKDAPKIKEACELLNQEKQFSLVIFPEGTFIDKGTKQKDFTFLDEQQKRRLEKDPNCPPSLPDCVSAVHKKVIFPRVKGFKLFIDELHTHLDCIINCTLYIKSLDPTKYPAEYYTPEEICKGHRQKMPITLILDYLPFEKGIETNSNTWLHQNFQARDKLLQDLDNLTEAQIFNYHRTHTPVNSSYETLFLRSDPYSTIFLSSGALLVLSLLLFTLYFAGTKLLSLCRPA